MWEKERWENIPLSQTDQLQGIHLCRMKVMTTIFPFRGRMDQEILWTVQVCGWWNSPLLIAGAGRHSPGERSLRKREDKSRVYVTSKKCPSQDSRTCWNLNKKPTYIRNVFEFLGWRKTVVEINVYLPWLWGSKDSHAYLSRVWACSVRSFWGGGCTGDTRFKSLNHKVPTHKQSQQYESLGSRSQIQVTLWYM